MNATFSKKLDFFGASSSALRLISSRAGYSRNVVETAGVCVINARDLSGDFIYPVCEYAVAQNTTLSFTLGKAYKYNGLGFFLTAVTVRTTVGAFPLVTFTGTANEGEDAIKKFPVSVNINARSKAQDVAGAFSLPSGCHLNTCETTWSAEPVVIIEPFGNGAKAVASDIQHGRVDANASTLLGSPSAASGWDFIMLPDPAGIDCDYELHTVTATRSLT